MKKKYMQPSIEVVKVSTTQMICESLGLGGAYNGSSEIQGKRRYADEDFDDDFSESIW